VRMDEVPETLHPGDDLNSLMDQGTIMDPCFKTTQ